MSRAAGAFTAICASCARSTRCIGVLPPVTRNVTRISWRTSLATTKTYRLVSRNPNGSSECPECHDRRRTCHPHRRHNRSKRDASITVCPWISGVPAPGGQETPRNASPICSAVEMALFGTIWHCLRGSLSQNAKSRNELRQFKKRVGTPRKNVRKVVQSGSFWRPFCAAVAVGSSARPDHALIQSLYLLSLLYLLSPYPGGIATIRTDG